MNSVSSAQKIRYLRDCYAADTSGLTMLNAFARSVEHRRFLDLEDALNDGEVLQIPLPEDVGEAVSEAAFRYRKEKKLVLASLFLAGRFPGGQEKVASPLVLYSASVEMIQEMPFLRVDLGRFRVNSALFNRWIDDPTRANRLHEALYEALQDHSFRREDAAGLQGAFGDHAPEVDATDLIHYPIGGSEEGLRSATGSASLALVSVACMALIKRSVEKRGILDELERMAESEHLSSAVRHLLGEPTVADTRKRVETHGVPVTLSRAQQAILQSAARSPLTLVNGPPGTGKSFTVAAIALEHMARGESVLIASKKDHAVDVIAEKLETMAGSKQSVVRGGRKHYLRDLKRYLENLLGGMEQSTSEQPNAKVLKGRIAQAEKAILRHQRAFGRRTKDEKAWARDKKVLGRSRWRPLLRFSTHLRERRLNRAKAPHRLIQNVEDRIRERNTLIRSRIGRRRQDRIHRVRTRHRAVLVDFLKSLRARTGGKRQELRDRLDFRVVLQALPVWMTKNSDIFRNLPLRSELFDVAILDEATQCDIPSSLPIINRAKRAVIVGDPKQLRHLSFLSRAEQKIFAEDRGLGTTEQEQLDYRQKSILDLTLETVVHQESVQFLDEHFRSQPDIIAFSNREFYEDQLKVMTQKPEASWRRNLSVQSCRGSRNGSGVNRKEAEAIVQNLADQIEAERHLPTEYVHSLGVTSPFRAQIDHLKDRLYGELEVHDQERHRLLIGTPHAFQGEERDRVHISFTLDEKSHPMAFRYLDEEAVFNVMITRARVHQVLYTSMESANLRPHSLLQRYLAFAEHYHHQERRREEAKVSPPSTDPIAAFFQGQGFRAWPAFEIAGMDIDLVLQRDSQVFGVDLMGFPGPFEDTFSMERYQMFRRAGLRILPLSYYRWKLEGESYLGTMLALVERMNRDG